MSLFTKTSSELDALTSEWSQQSDAVDEQIELLVDLAQQQEAVDGEVLATLQESAGPVHTSLSSLSSRLEALGVALRKFVTKANEGKADPDKAIYGAGMVSKIEQAATKLSELEAAVKPKQEAFQGAYASLQTRMADAQKAAEEKKRADEVAAQAEAERAAAAAREAERVRVEEEKKAAAAAAEKAKADAAAAAAAKAAAEAQAKKDAEEKAAAAAAAREQVVAERRAAEARAAAERDSSDKAEEAAAASQSPQEQLDSALAELKAGLSPAELTIALQTLHKFVQNIMGAPQDERLRHIRLSNEVFKKRLGDKAGGMAALRAIGFAAWRSPPAAALPAGSDLKAEEDYLRMEAKAELWPVLVAAKKTLDEAMRQNRLRDPLPAGAAPATPSAAGAAPAGAAASPFAGLFGAGGAGASPFGSLFGAGSGGASPAVGSGAPPLNPAALMSDPFLQAMMSNPTILSNAMAAAQGGGQTPQMQQALIGEVMSNPQLMSSMMQSPLVQQMMSDPSRMQQMMQSLGGAGPLAGAAGAPPAFPFPNLASMFGGGAPLAGGAAPAAGGAAANPMASFLQQMMAARGGAAPAAAGAAATPAASPFAMFQQAIANPQAGGQQSAAPAAATPAAAAAAPASASSAGAPAAAAAPAAAPAAAAETDEEMEERLLQEAIQMSLSSEQPPGEKKE